MQLLWLDDDAVHLLKSFPAGRSEPVKPIWIGLKGMPLARDVGYAVKSHPTATPCLARKNDPSEVAETGGAELQIAEQSRSWRAAIGEREVMRGS